MALLAAVLAAVAPGPVAVRQVQVAADLAPVLQAVALRAQSLYFVTRLFINSYDNFKYFNYCKCLDIRTCKICQ